MATCTLRITLTPTSRMLTSSTGRNSSMGLVSGDSEGRVGWRGRRVVVGMGVCWGCCEYVCECVHLCLCAWVCECVYI